MFQSVAVGQDSPARIFVGNPGFAADAREETKKAALGQPFSLHGIVA
jgi:hypothetical protein